MVEERGRAALRGCLDHSGVGESEVLLHRHLLFALLLEEPRELPLIVPPCCGPGSQLISSVAVGGVLLNCR